MGCPLGDIFLICVSIPYHSDLVREKTNTVHNWENLGVVGELTHLQSKKNFLKQLNCLFLLAFFLARFVRRFKFPARDSYLIF